MHGKISLVTLLLLTLIVSCSNGAIPPMSSRDTLSTPATLPHGMATTHYPAESPANLVPGVNTQCLAISEDHTFGSEGVLVMQDLLSSAIRFVNAQNGQDVSLFQLNNWNLDGFAVSPNRRNLALWYIGVSESEGGGLVDRVLVILDAKGKRESETGMTGLLPVEWLDNDRIIMTPTIKQPSRPNDLVLLNPFTGEEQELQSDYPEIYGDSAHLYWGNYASSGTVYDPTLSLVIYPKFGIDSSGVVLWDVKAEKEIVELPFGDYGKRPKWAPDGSAFAIIALGRLYYDDIYLISRDGTVKRLTYLADTYPPVFIHEYSWSPDGKRIAFWMSRNSQKPFTDLHLGVADLSTGEVIDYCSVGNSMDLHPPVWSPDGTKLLVAAVDPQRGSRVVLVDIVNNLASQVASPAIPLGWMISLEAISD